MSIAIVGMGTAKAGRLEELKTKPEFRKATLNMMLAAFSQDDALENLAAHLKPDTLALSSMILGSSYGELGVTIGFLDYFSKSGVARPLLFQNSLHNSTLGFLALRLVLKGPAFTVSNSVVTGENCIELAITTLHADKTPLCVVTCVDSIVTQLRVDDQLAIGSQGEGAATLLLARLETAHRQGWPILACIKSIDYHLFEPSVAASKQGLDPKTHYHSDAIERIVEHLGMGKSKSQLNLQKSDGRQTTIHFGVGS